MSTAIVIGRFQPFHLGHKAMVEKALEVASNVIVVIGSTGCWPDLKNPFSVDERTNMIRAVFPGLTNLSIVSVEDHPYDDERWAQDLRDVVGTQRVDDEVFLIGNKKDHSSFYLDMFPDWKFVEVAEVKGVNIGCRIDATLIREFMFEPRNPRLVLEGLLPSAVSSVLGDCITDDRAAQLHAEATHVLDHRHDWDCRAVRRWGGPILTAADALVHDSTHILLIRRKGPVGAGALALPGGFVNVGERIVDAAIRELKEETGVEIHVREHSGGPSGDYVVAFDNPRRSLSGRTVTHVLQHNVYRRYELSTPVAGDDAEWAGWVPIAELDSLKSQFFSDHFHIINHLFR